MCARMCVCACSVVCYICILNMCCVCACVLLCIRSIPYKGYYVSMCVKPILRQYCAVLISVRIISMYSRMRVRMCLSLAYDRERRFCASLISSGLDSRTCLHRTRITQAHWGFWIPAQQRMHRTHTRWCHEGSCPCDSAVCRWCTAEGCWWSSRERLLFA